MSFLPDSNQYTSVQDDRLAEKIVRISPEIHVQNHPPFGVEEYVPDRDRYPDAERFVEVTYSPVGVRTFLNRQGRCKRYLLGVWQTC